MEMRKIMEQMMARQLAEMNFMQERTNDNQTG
jgi:hypothetical protein